MDSRIDATFVRRWSPVYIEQEDDEEEYKEILKAVQTELRETGSISRKSFMKIIAWKAPRLLGEKGWIGRHLKKGLYTELYSRRIRAVTRTPDKEKIFMLKAPGG